MTQTRIARYSQSNLVSKVTSGRRAFAEGGDGRSAWTRRWRDLTASHAADLGDEGLTEAQISLCRRAAATEVCLEQLEARMSEGQQIDLDQYTRVTSRLCKMFLLLGVRRVTKPFDPLTEFAKSFESYPPKPPPDDDDDDGEPAPEEPEEPSEA